MGRIRRILSYRVKIHENISKNSCFNKFYSCWLREFKYKVVLFDLAKNSVRVMSKVTYSYGEVIIIDILLVLSLKRTTYQI